jgi:hypothetical protein
VFKVLLAWPKDILQTQVSAPYSLQISSGVTTLYLDSTFFRFATYNIFVFFRDKFCISIIFSQSFEFNI